MLGHVMALCDHAGIKQKMVVTGHQAERVKQAALALDENAQSCIQDPQLGTAHAVLQAEEFLKSNEGDVVVLYADTPMIHPETIKQMQDIRAAGFDMVFLGFQSHNPSGYGRLIQRMVSF